MNKIVITICKLDHVLENNRILYNTNNHGDSLIIIMIY